MTPRAQEVWSYIIGLGPVGKPVHVTREILREDLNIVGRANWSRILNILIADGCIERVSWDVLIVRARIPAEPEPEPVINVPAPHVTIGHYCERQSIVRDWEQQVRLIPEDTRDLTARMFGDPLPARSALAQRAFA